MPFRTEQILPVGSGSGGGLTPTQHRSLDQLVHEISETSYYEVTYDGTYSWRRSSEIWWTNNGKTVKIREIDYTYYGTVKWKYNTIVFKQYDGTGTLVETYTGTVTYSGVYISYIDWVLS